MAELHFRPRLSVEQEYNDNWFRAEKNEEEFWVTRVSPGFNLEASTERSRLSLDGAYGYSWHNSPDDDTNASDQDYSSVDASLLAAYRLFSRLTFGLSDEFFRTREPASTDEFSEVVDRAVYWRNRVSPSILYAIDEKGSVELGYRNERLKWVTNTDPGQDDSWENRGILTLTYNLNSTYHLDLESQVWRRTYDGNDVSDYDSYQGELIFRHEFNTYLRGQVGGGYQKRDYDDSALGEQEEFVFDAALNGATELSKLEVAVARNVVDYTTDDEYFTAIRAQLFAEHIFLGAIRAYLGGYYQNSDFRNSKREDDTYNGYGGLGYKFFDKLFEVSLEYNYTERDSNERGRDYQENRVFLRLDFVYDASDLIRK
jgi:hypothetical protein